jgi:sec-independent protein translocase protein TatC
VTETDVPRRIRLRRTPRRVSKDGSMPLGDHLRELRNRLFKAALAIFLCGIIGWVYYDQIFDFLREPFDDYRDKAIANGESVELTLTGITSAFTLKLNVAMFVGLVLATPVWTYQLWAFLRPGLHQRERRFTLAFVFVSTPLFLLGIGLSYLLLPGALEILLELTPGQVANLPTVSDYLSFVLRLSVAFGLGFLMPVVVVALNLAGVLSAARLRSWWRGAIVGVFVFTAVITPTPDPWNMTLLAIPILVLLLIAWGIAWFHDRRKARDAAGGEWSDEDGSPIAPAAPIEDAAPIDPAEAVSPPDVPGRDAH